jgi:hypothetical protein
MGRDTLQLRGTGFKKGLTIVDDVEEWEGRERKALW